MGHHHHSHESCDVHILPETWKDTFPRLFIYWGSAEVAIGGLLGSSSIASNGVHDIADGISLRPQAENVDGTASEHTHKSTNRDKANNILFALGFLSATKSGFDLFGINLPEADITETVKHTTLIGLAGVSLTINSLAAKEPIKRCIGSEFIEKLRDIHNREMLGHLAIDIGASSSALVAALLATKGVLPKADAVVGASIGLVTMAGYQPKWFYENVTKPVSELQLPDSTLNMLSGNLVPRAGQRLVIHAG